MINDLHWLPILARVRYKVLLLVAKSHRGIAPKYLCERMSKPQSACSSRPLHSADRFDLLVPWSHTSLSQNRTFAVVGPALWNDTPPALRSVMLQGILWGIWARTPALSTALLVRKLPNPRLAAFSVEPTNGNQI